jgi:hypothetical protein
MELESLWDDMSQARRSAYPGCWSTQCGGLAERIVMLSRHVGATPWGNVQVELLLDGVYQRIYDEADIAYDPPDLDRAREILERRRW